MASVTFFRDLLVTHGTPGTRAAKRATTTTPIVMANSGDPVGTGLIASLAHPGGNLTGSTFISPEHTAKRLELLKEAVPRVRRVAALVNPGNSEKEPVLQAMALTARSLKLELNPFEVRGSSEFESVFTAMAKRRIDALVAMNDAILIANAGSLADLAAQRRLAGGSVAQRAVRPNPGVMLPAPFDQELRRSPDPRVHPGASQRRTRWSSSPRGSRFEELGTHLKPVEPLAHYRGAAHGAVLECR